MADPVSPQRFGEFARWRPSLYLHPSLAQPANLRLLQRAQGSGLQLSLQPAFQSIDVSRDSFTPVAPDHGWSSAPVATRALRLPFFDESEFVRASRDDDVDDQANVFSSPPPPARSELGSPRVGPLRLRSFGDTTLVGVGDPGLGALSLGGESLLSSGMGGLGDPYGGFSLNCVEGNGCRLSASVGGLPVVGGMSVGVDVLR